MASRSTRRLLFWCVCIPVRLAIVAAIAAAALQGPEWLRICAAAFCLVVSTGFVWTAARGFDKGLGFEGEVWWNHLRPVHAFLWLAAAILLLLRPAPQWTAPLPLALDVCLGMMAWWVVGPLGPLPSATGVPKK